MVEGVVDMKRPMISVLMSCFNAERWLAECVESVLNQTIKDFEFIIVNDGSVDNTSAIINQYALRDARIILFEKENTGLADSLNCGIRIAKGNWIARIDADDICHNRRLEKQTRFVENNAEVVLLGSGFEEINTMGATLMRHKYPMRHLPLVRRLERFRAFFPHSSSFYKRDIVHKLGGYRHQFRRSQDWDLWLRMSEHGKLACVTEPLVKVRKHDNQVSHEHSGKRQLIDCHAATISYFIRKFGVNDPIANENDTKVIEFMTWVEERLGRKGVFQSREDWANARTAFFSEDSSILGAFRLVNKIMKSPYAIPLLIEKMIGSDLPEQLAREWIDGQ